MTPGVGVTDTARGVMLAVMSDTRTTPPGWYDDGTGRQRWWDGAAWGPFSPAPSIVVEQAPPKAPMSGAAVAGFVIGLLGFLVSLIPGVGVVVGGVGALIAGAGLFESNRRGKSGRGLASAGIVLGVIAVFVGIMIVVVVGPSQA